MYNLKSAKRTMSRIKSVKAQVVALALAGTVALSSVLGSGVAYADSPNLAPNPSFENAGSDFGWVSDAKGTDASFGDINDPEFAADGSAVSVWGSKSANKGWPGYETKEIIPVDSNKEYTFSASYFAYYGGLPWMDMTLFDADGKRVGSVSTGTSPVQESPEEWHEKIYNFKPALLKKYFGDIAGVKLGLKLSLNYGVAGIEDGTVTVLVYDNVKFEEVAANEPDLIVTSLWADCCWGSPGQPSATNPNGVPVFSIEKQKNLLEKSFIRFAVKNVGTADVTGPIKATIVNVTKDGEPWDKKQYFTIKDALSWTGGYDSPLSPGEEATTMWAPFVGTKNNQWKVGLYTLQVMVDHYKKIDELFDDNNVSEEFSFEVVE